MPATSLPDPFLETYRLFYICRQRLCPGHVASYALAAGVDALGLAGRMAAAGCTYAQPAEVVAVQLLCCHILSLIQSEMTFTESASNLGLANCMKYIEALPDLKSEV